MIDGVCDLFVLWYVRLPLLQSSNAFPQPPLRHPATREKPRPLNTSNPSFFVHYVLLPTEPLPAASPGGKVHATPSPTCCCTRSSVLPPQTRKTPSCAPAGPCCGPARRPYTHARSETTDRGKCW
ncbi:hypothetical protein BOTBODRAFT_59823 [Botryobasidium botryosum FD-172 SS1]|uniref:Uncharacterized protein n=1 Tax=Botryobasidium botryosum (strain FD-172 SS1) TaxID=930990 RepID=A0A067LWD9_BOTB1|nr:hypothetical protein BOTBODRAFT_59823 [Botryobasidium botryosum FD-172 SS1]